jgi:hypothetical protein
MHQLLPSSIVIYKSALATACIWHSFYQENLHFMEVNSMRSTCTQQNGWDVNSDVSSPSEERKWACSI